MAILCSGRTRNIFYDDIMMMMTVVGKFCENRTFSHHISEAVRRSIIVTIERELEITYALLIGAISTMTLSDP